MNDKPVIGIPLKTTTTRAYKLVECKKRGCKILLPDDLKWCGLHNPIYDERARRDRYRP